jgi:hypothetical protein
MPGGDLDVKMRALVPLLLTITALMVLLPLATAQSRADSGDSSSATTLPLPEKTGMQLDLAYTRPTEKTVLHNYVFDAFGPYPMVSAALNAGIDQANENPPEWKQGTGGYSRRFGSNFGIGVVTTTTRYALGEALREDTSYYRCECKGMLPRLRHAVISTFTARRGEDGHRALSLSALAAPYAGTIAAVYGWYPDRFGAKDALRMGNYSLLEGAVGNIVLEFLYSGPHALLSRVHRNNGRGTPASGSHP